MALGYTLVYGIIELINFAHGDVFMWGTMITVTVAGTRLGLDGSQNGLVTAGGLLLTLLAAMIFCGALNTGHRTRRLPPPEKRAHAWRRLISAIGVSFVLAAWPAKFYGFGYTGVGDIMPTHDAVRSLGGVPYRLKSLLVVVITIPVLLALVWWVRNTRQGKAMRAVAQDTEASRMMGINVDRTISFTFAVAGALAGAAGVLYVTYFTQTRFDLGLPARPVRLHGGRAGRDRQPPGRRARRAADRVDHGLQRRALVARAGVGLDAVGRLHDPDPDPGVPARGPARRAGGRPGMTSRPQHLDQGQADHASAIAHRGGRPARPSTRSTSRIW